jgi:hypothetical protein
MLHIRWCALAFALASMSAQAQDPEVARLREELKALQQRLETLEKKLQQAEARPPAPSAEAVPASSKGEGAFNPGVSAILNGVYANLKRDPAAYRINGFVPTRGDVAPPPRGLSLGESELGISGNIDPTFRGTLVAALSPDGNTASIEEANVQTLGLANGFTVKAGRFFSSTGYQNQLHAHAWDFTDAPLVMKAFLGGQLADDGVQVKWVAPTSLYLDLGAELGRGRAFPAAGRDKNGFGATTLFAHLGGDLGESTAWQVGLSQLRTSPRDRGYDDVDSTGTAITNALTGRSTLWAAEGVLKWAPDGNPTERNFKLQGEYFRRSETGTLTYDTAAASLGTRSGSYASRQAGWYLQGVYQFMPQWRAGYRFDQLNAGTTALGLVDSGALRAADFPILGAYNPKRHTLMVDWSPSEFSRIRLQLARDYSRMGEPDNQMFLQYVMSLGAHGAHRF